jgi:hypothetical protein
VLVSSRLKTPPQTPQSVFAKKDGNLLTCLHCLAQSVSAPASKTLFPISIAAPVHH